MDKLYERINWENEPSIVSPLNATNLNKIDYAVNELDNRTISLDTTKASKSEMTGDIVDVSFNELNGIFTFKRRNGSTVQLDTQLEKVAVNWVYDNEEECLVLTLSDGTKQKVDLSKLITVYEFVDSDTITLSINSAGKVVASVKNNSITEEHLEADYLANIKVESAKAERASTSASASATSASVYATQAKQFRDEAETFTPDGYSDLVQNVAENTAKIDTVIEKAELNIKNTASGEIIHITDSADSKVLEFGLHGKAEQKQYSGKNLLQNTAITRTLNGVTFTVNEDKSVTVKGTATAWTEVLVHNKKETFKKGETYVFTSGSKTWNPCCFLTGLDGTTEWRIDGFSCTPTEDVTVMCGIYVGSGITVDETFYPMIRKASITDGTYETYVGGKPSPSPDYPQDIEVAGESGSVEVKSVGENLLNMADAKGGNNSGIDVVVKKDGSYTYAGTANGTNINIWLLGSYNNTSILFTLKAGKYYIKGVNLYYDGSSVFVSGRNGGILILSKDTPVGGVRAVSAVTGNTYDEVHYPIIALSDKEVPWQPYKETTSTISTPDGLAGINGVYDEVVKYADGSGKRFQRVGKSVIDGSKRFETSTSNHSENCMMAYCNGLPKGLDTNLGSATQGYCDKFQMIDAVYNPNTDIEGVGVHYIAGEASSRFEIRIRKDRLSSVDVAGIKAWLAENPVTVYYRLATPIITDLTAEEMAEIEKLHTFYPVTNISNDADCGMAVAYLADSKNYIDNQLAIQAQAQEEALLNMLLLMPESVQASMIENDTNNLLNEAEV